MKGPIEQAIEHRVNLTFMAVTVGVFCICVSIMCICVGLSFALKARTEVKILELQLKELQQAVSITKQDDPAPPIPVQ